MTLNSHRQFSTVCVAYHDLSKHENLFLALGEKTIILGDKDLDEIHKSKKNKKKTSTG